MIFKKADINKELFSTQAMKVCFLTSGHDPFDDRIFYHMARSIAGENNSVSIITSTCKKTGYSNGIKLNCFEGTNLPKSEKVIEFIDRLKDDNANVIICSEPLPVFAAKEYKKLFQKKAKIIYDITEWYPSKKNLYRYNQLNKYFHFFRLLTFNIWISSYANAFIFGEWYKSIPYRILFPRKQFIYTSYFPDLNYINPIPHELFNNKLRLSYSGKLTNDKGFDNFINVVDGLSERHMNLKIEVKVIGWPDPCEKNNSKKLFPQKKNIEVTWFEKLPFFDYLNLIRDTDIFLDLRNNDFENTHCLPVKLFYYAAFGRPVIISDLKSIRKAIDISSFGFLVKPSGITEITGIISKYLDDREKYENHCLSSRLIIEEKYNWKLIESDFVKFITDRKVIS